MDFEEFKYDTVEIVDFDLCYYKVELTQDLVLMLGGVDLPTMFKAGTTFDRADYLLESKLIVFRNDDNDYGYSATVKLRID